MFWVSFSSAPECVDRHCWTTPFSTPPRAQGHGYYRRRRCFFLLFIIFYIISYMIFYMIFYIIFYIIYFIIFYIVFYIIFLFITKVNIDIGTKILKQKCFGRKTYIPGTFFNFKPAKKIYGSSSIRSAYSRGCGTSILMSFF